MTIADEFERELERATAKFPDCVKLPDGTGRVEARRTWRAMAQAWCDRAQREGILTHADVFEEEVAEALAESDPVLLRKELVQVGAMILKWVRDIDSRPTVSAAAETTGGCARADTPEETGTGLAPGAAARETDCASGGQETIRPGARAQRGEPISTPAAADILSRLDQRVADIVEKHAHRLSSAGEATAEHTASCEFCGTQAGQKHDHWRHVIKAQVAALEDVVGGDKTDERLAKLEECARTAWEVGKPAPFATPTVQHSGAIVKDEPPAGQPSRQETGGDCGVSGCRACTAMRDRAKAKEADQDDEDWYCEGCGGECMDPINHGRKVSQLPEPSGTGQLPSAPVGFRVVGRSGPDVTQSKGLWIRRARDCRDDSPANGEPRQITLPGSLGGVWDLGEYDILEPIAELPAPAAGTLGLADQLRQYNTEEELEALHCEVSALEARHAHGEKGRQANVIDPKNV